MTEILPFPTQEAFATASAVSLKRNYQLMARLGWEDSLGTVHKPLIEAATARAAIAIHDPEQRVLYPELLEFFIQVAFSYDSFKPDRHFMERVTSIMSATHDNDIAANAMHCLNNARMAEPSLMNDAIIEAVDATAKRFDEKETAEAAYLLVEFLRTDGYRPKTPGAKRAFSSTVPTLHS